MSDSHHFTVYFGGDGRRVDSRIRKEVWAGAKAAAEVIAEGEDESRFERIRQLTQDNAPCYTIKRLKGRHPLNGPWCIWLRAEVPNKTVCED